MASTAKASPPIPFGEWLPDLPDFNGGALVMQNVIPYGQNYKPFASLAEATAALPGKCIGAITYQDGAGNITYFAGTLTNLYMMSSGSWVDVTRQTSGADVVYTTESDGFWDFVIYGTLVIATNNTDTIQAFDMASSTIFAALAATAPICQRLAVVSNFLIAVNVFDVDDRTGYRLRWSSLGDPAGDWTDAPLTTQADFEDIPQGDPNNTAVFPLDGYGLIIQSNNLWRMDYVGGADIFYFTPLLQKRGSVLPRSCISNGRQVYFLDEDGFYEYDSLTGSVNPIGNEKVNKFFYSIFNQAYDFNLNAGVDPINTIIYWSFPSTSAVGGANDTLLAYNWLTHRWSLINQAMDCLFTYISTGYTMDDMDSAYPDVDTLPFSLDSRFWTGGLRGLAAFDSNHCISTFTGPTLPATIGTAEIRPNESGRAQLATVIPYIEGGAAVTMSLGHRQAQANNTITYTPSVSANPYTGEFDFDIDDVFFRVEVVLTGNWTFAQGIAYRATPTASA